MIYKEKAILLKDGRTAILKTPEKKHAAEMLSYIKTACGETDFLARYPEEWEGITPESEEKWIEATIRSQNEVTITCFLDGRIAGNCSLNFKSGIKVGHRAAVAIALLREFWGLGIASVMFEEMIDIAQKRGCEILELELIEGNTRAQQLYEKFGFTAVAKRPNAFKLKDGTIKAEIFMQKELKHP